MRIYACKVIVSYLLCTAALLEHLSLHCSNAVCLLGMSNISHLMLNQVRSMILIITKLQLLLVVSFQEINQVSSHN